MIMHKMKSKLHTTAAVFAATASALTMSVAVVPSASAAPVEPSGSTSLVSAYRTVCAQSLYVRYKASGVIIGTLYYGDHFLTDGITSDNGYWVHGHAYGNVHQDGWVENGWFC